MGGYPAWLSFLVGATLLLACPAAAARANRPPNIVLVIGDDHGWAYSGFTGDPVVETPVLDTLAAEGTVFSQAQVPASICRPTLQALLSGLHPRQWEATRQALAAEAPIPYRQEVAQIRTLPRELGRRSYLSWEGGKMWEGSYEQAGFTHGMATTQPSGLFFIEGDDLGRTGWDPARCGDTRVSESPCPALDPLRGFLDVAGSRPFFLWFAPMLPHLPFDAPAEFTERYAGRGLTPAEVLYYAQVTRLDAVIGELLRELDERGLREDTLVVYLADNGWEIGQGYFGHFGHGKGSLHELGMRTPLIFHWPGRVPAGVVRDDLVVAEDLFPTLLDYAGAEPVADRSGRSLRPAIERGEPVDREHYVTSFVGVAAEYSGHVVRSASARFMAFADGHEELYEVAVDPFEQQDLVPTHGVLLADLRARVSAWEAGIAAPPQRLEITGRLVDANEQPIAGAALALVAGPVSLQALSGPDGAFRFQNLPHGDYVIAPAAGEATDFDERLVRIPVGPTGRELGAIVGLRAGAPTPPRSAPGTLSGLVTTPWGAPRSDAMIRIRSLDRRQRSDVVVRTDARGRYLAEHLPPGSYTVEALGPSGRRRAQALVQVRGGTRRTRDLVLKALPSPTVAAPWPLPE